MSSIRFVSLRPYCKAEPSGLEPAPSVKDWDDISEGLKGVQPIDAWYNLQHGEHGIRGSYRGWSLYLYPNVRVRRVDPKTEGGHGYAGATYKGLVEKVHVHMDGEVYEGQAEFV